jgi:hypothetical protein
MAALIKVLMFSLVVVTIQCVTGQGGQQYYNPVRGGPGGRGGPGRADSPKLPNVAAWQLLNQLGSKILLQFPFVLARRKEGFCCPNIWHLPIPAWQLP